MRSLSFALVTMVFFGVAPLLEKAGLKGLGTFQALAVRSWAVGLVSLIFLAWRGDLVALGKAEPRFLFLVILGGLCAGFLGQATYYIALRTGEASRVVPVVAAFPLVTSLLGIVFLRESLTFVKVLGILLTTVGILLLRLG